MSRQKNSAARLLKEVQRRRTAENERRMAELRERAELEAAAFGPRPVWCDFQPWGYLMAERDGIDTPTGYYPVVDYVREHSFAELRGQVTA